MYLPDGFGLSPHMAGLAETYQVLYMIGVLMIVEVSGGPNVMDRKTVPYMSPAVKALPILLPYHYEPYSFPPSATVRGRTSYPKRGVRAGKTDRVVASSALRGAKSSSYVGSPHLPGLPLKCGPTVYASKYNRRYEPGVILSSTFPYPEGTSVGKNDVARLKPIRPRHVLSKAPPRAELLPLSQTRIRSYLGAAFQTVYDKRHSHILQYVDSTIIPRMCGIGRAGKAALKNGRSFLGIDLGPGYVKMAREYIAKSVDAVVTSTW